MNLACFLTALLLSASAGLADERTPAPGQTPVAGGAATEPAPELTRLDQILSEAQQKQKNGRESPVSDKDWVQKFRADLDATMAQIPQTTANTVLYARILSRLGEPGEAAASLDQALKQDPDNPALKTAKGYALYDQKDYAAAAAAANGVLKENPLDQQALALKHISEARAPSVKLPGSPWENLSPPQGAGGGIGRGAGDHDDPNLPIKLAVKMPSKFVDVPSAVTTSEPAPSPGQGSFPLWPMTVPLGVGLIGYGVYGSKQTYATEGGLDPNPKTSQDNAARNWRMSAAVAGTAFIALATWEYGPGAYAAAQAFFSATAPPASTLTPVLAGAGAGGGSAVLDSTLVTAGVKAAGASTVFIGGAKAVSDYYSYAKSSQESDGDSTKHGQERLSDQNPTRGGTLSSEEARTVKSTGRVMNQRDGGKVYLQEIEPGKYNILVENTEGKMITTFRHLRASALERLATNYGWH